MTDTELRSELLRTREVLRKLYDAASAAHNCRDYYEKDQPETRKPGGGIDCLILNEAAEILKV